MRFRRAIVLLLVSGVAACSSHQHSVFVAPGAVGPTTTMIEWQKPSGQWEPISVSTNGTHNFQMPTTGAMRVTGTNPLYETTTVPLTRDDLVVNLNMEQKPGVTPEQILAATNETIEKNRLPPSGTSP